MVLTVYYRYIFIYADHLRKLNCAQHEAFTPYVSYNTGNVAYKLFVAKYFVQTMSHGQYSPDLTSLPLFIVYESIGCLSCDPSV